MSLNCHHGNISRLQAEQLLVGAKDDGSFLIRDSESIHGAYTLCVLYQGRVHQYRILPDSDGKLSVQAEKGVNERKFVDLIQLIHEYIHRGDANGLVCALKNPVPVETPEKEDSEDDEDFEKSSSETASPSDMSSLSPDINENRTHPYGSFHVSSYFQQRFNLLDLSIQDGEFANLVKDYVDSGVQRDLVAVNGGEEELTSLRQLLTHACRDLDRQLNFFLAKVDILRQLFGELHTSPLCPLSKLQDRSNTNLDLGEILEQLSTCKTAVGRLEKKAFKVLQDLKDDAEDESKKDQDAPPLPARAPAKITIPPATFEVRIVKHGKQSSKVKLTVDLMNGKLFIVRTNKDVMDDSNVICPDKIIQLVKNTKHNTYLEVKVEGRKKETYAFEDVRQRENFCQFMQMMKSMHSNNKEVDHLSIFIGTWNMGADPPAWNLGPWLKSQGVGKTRSKTLGVIPHDMYVIGTQESALTEKDWLNRIKMIVHEATAQDMHVVASESLWGLRLVVLIKEEHKNRISHVQHSTVKTGVANALGNKGAVGVAFHFNGTSFCFINCHLTSGHERNNRRNQNFRDIIKGLSLGQKNLNMFDITNQFHHLFWFGDLNYRIQEMDPQEIIRKVTLERNSSERNYSALLGLDQLQRSQAIQEAFFGFREEEITFPPTYRFEKSSKDKYVWQKFKRTGTRINAPSYCDRVLWKSYPELYIQNTSYGMNEDMLTSDHKPVFASFDVGLVGQCSITKAPTCDHSDVKIAFEEICATVKTTSRQYFQVEFYSSCLEGPVMSKQNSKFQQCHMNFCCPRWQAKELPVLIPLLMEKDYLEDQHLLLAVKTADNMESYGECVVSLRSMFSVKPEPFECYLMHQGEETGKIRGLMHVKLKEGADTLNRRKQRKSYELIYIDTEVIERKKQELGLDTNTLTSSPDNTPTPTSAPIHQSLVSSRSHSLENRAAGHQHSSPSRWSLSPSIKTSSSSYHVLQPHSNGNHGNGSADQSGASNGMGGEHKPLIPPRRPRMGQSSLTQSSVIPLVSQRKDGARSQSPAQSLQVDENSNTAPLYTQVKRENKRQSNQDPHRMASVYDDSDRAYVNQVVMHAAQEKSAEGATSKPQIPPRKPRLSDSNEDHYASLKRPISVNEWLLNLGLPQYIPAFFDNGLESLDKLCHITDRDLTHMSIVESEHQTRLLRSIQDLT